MNPGANYILLNNSGPGETMITLPDTAGMAQSFGVYGACLYVEAEAVVAAVREKLAR